MKELFDNKQEQILFCNSGKAYIHYNEKEVRVIESVQVGEDSYEDREVTKWEYDVVKIPFAERTEESVLASLKEMLIAEIDEYNQSSEVDDFEIGGYHLWLPSDMRSKVRENLEVCDLEGIKETTLRFGGLSFHVSVENGWKMYYAVLAYAREAWNVTQQHISNVMAMATVEEIMNYDYKSGYPPKISLAL